MMSANLLNDLYRKTGDIDSCIKKICFSKKIFCIYLAGIANMNFIFVPNTRIESKAFASNFILFNTCSLIKQPLVGQMLPVISATNFMQKIFFFFDLQGYKQAVLISIRIIFILLLLTFSQQPKEIANLLHTIIFTCIHVQSLFIHKIYSAAVKIIEKYIYAVS